MHPCNTGTEALYRPYGSEESRSIAVLFLDHGTRRGELLASRPSRFLPLGKKWYPLYMRLSGPQSRSGHVRKMSPPLGFDPRTVFGVGTKM